MKNGHTTRQKAPASRYALLDELRGLDLVSMMLYHACWDMMFLFGIWMDWYAGMPGRLWQQTICWVFILLSGFCVQLGHHTLRRGAQVFGAGALVTAVTLLFMPEDRVIFGVLTLLGSAMLLTGVLEPLLKKIPPAAGLAVSAVLFALTYHLDERWLGFGGAVCTDLSSGRALARLRRAAPCVAGCMVRELLYSVFRLSALRFLFHRLFCPAAVAVFVLGRVLSARRGGPGADGTAAPFGLPGAGLDGPALAFAVSAAPAGDLRRTFGRGSSFCIKGLTQPGSCGILSVVRRY